MSLFTKILSLKEKNVIESIIENLQVLFSNRTDEYWSYDNNSQSIVALHDIFKLDKFSEDFLYKLSCGIELWDPRIKRSVCSWSFNLEDPILNIQCILKDNPIDIQCLSIPLKDLK
ncbi:hypothetical protein [Alphaproteobacteria bacterium endosymbiont of Tiliacea citrago]|uniref:hypothetical protein n=1 Tax=Alphaproteobacteria bacterium endosymbiont of Tiliacea citrago TaxID=3077944 RepID=UPI00313F0092